ERGGVSRRELQLLKEELLSDIPVLHRTLIRFEIFTRLQNVLKQADVKILVNRFILISLILGLVGGTLVLVFSGSIFATIVVTVGGMIAPLLFVLHKRRVRFKHFLEQLPDALELMVRSLQAGHSFSSALQMVATEMPDPIAREFGKAYEEQNLGLNLKNALENLAERMPLLDLKMCVTAVLIQRETGGNLAEILEKVANTIRERFRIMGDLKTLTTSSRMSAWLLCGLPIFVAMAVTVMNPDYMSVLWKDPRGHYLIAVAMTMQITGMLIVRKILKIKI